MTLAKRRKHFTIPSLLFNRFTFLLRLALARRRGRGPRSETGGDMGGGGVGRGSSQGRDTRGSPREGAAGAMFLVQKAGRTLCYF